MTSDKTISNKKATTSPKATTSKKTTASKKTSASKESTAIMNKPEMSESKLSAMDKAMYNKLKKEISAELAKVEKSYLTIAYKVHHIYTQKLFTIDGFKTIYDWSAKEFKLARGTTNNYINICEKFGKIEPDGTCKSLLPQYSAFTSSQLILMLSMDENTRNLITADMTIKQIKQKKKDADSESEKEDDSESDSKASKSEPEDSDDTKDAKIQDNLLCIMQLASADDFSESNIKTISEVFAEFRQKHKNLTPRISIDIRWTK